MNRNDELEVLKGNEVKMQEMICNQKYESNNLEVLYKYQLFYSQVSRPEMNYLMIRIICDTNWIEYPENSDFGNQHRGDEEFKKIVRCSSFYIQKGNIFLKYIYEKTENFNHLELRNYMISFSIKYDNSRT